MKKRSSKQGGSFIGIYEYQNTVRLKTPDAVPAYVASTYRLLFDEIETPLVHWYFLHRANQYQILWLDNRLETCAMKQRRREALRLNLLAISDPVSRDVVRVQVECLATPDFTAENSRLRARHRPRYARPWELGAWSAIRFNWEEVDATR